MKFLEFSAHSTVEEVLGRIRFASEKLKYVSK